MAAEGVAELTDTNFEETVTNSEKPVLVDFWASWCAPCRRIAPIVEEIAGEFGDKLVVGKLDIDANQAVTAKYGVQSIPTLMIFKGGEMKERIVGAQPKNVLVEAINRVM